MARVKKKNAKAERRELMSKVDPVYSWVQENIEFLMQRTGVTTEEIVEHLGIGRTTYFAHKRGPWEFRLDQVVALGRLFGVDPGLLLSETKLVHRWYDGEI